MKITLHGAAPAAALILVLGCGGGADDGASGEATAGGEAGGHHHHHGPHAEAGHAHRMSPAQERFHDLFAPIWHGEPGVDRAVRACAAATEIQTLGLDAASAVVEGREAPAEDDEAAMTAWDDDQAIQTDMEQATRLLIIEACGAGEENDVHTDAEYFDEENLALVQQQLSRIHDVFHAAMERWQATHPE